MSLSPCEGLRPIWLLNNILPWNHMSPAQCGKLSPLLWITLTRLIYLAILLFSFLVFHESLLLLLNTIFDSETLDTRIVGLAYTHPGSGCVSDGIPRLGRGDDIAEESLAAHHHPNKVFIVNVSL